VLLHGGLCTLETFDGLTPLLTERFRVYTPERRGHGRTADVEGLLKLWRHTTAPAATSRRPPAAASTIPRNGA
jgi:pimeloyl-ACP methyl ester carboxylesterase